MNSLDNIADHPVYGSQLPRYALCDEHQLLEVSTYLDEHALLKKDVQKIAGMKCKETNRICLFEVTNRNAIYCGPCGEGFVQINDSCVNINTMDWSDYYNAFDPVYSEREDRILPDDQQRLQVLKDAAKFIVELNLRNSIIDLVNNSSTETETETDIKKNVVSISDDSTFIWDHYLNYTVGLTPYSADYTEEDYRSRSGYIYQNLTDDDLKPFNVSEYNYDSQQRLNNSTRRSLQEGGLFNNGGGLTATSDINTNTIPDRVDWVDLGGVTHVKDQGRCGCCWAISLNGAIEGGVYSDPNNNGYLQSLSFQQLISCSKTNGGCDGGNLALASLYTQIGLFKGVTRLNDYPYTDYFGKTTTECLAPANVFSTTSSSSGSSTTTEMPLAVQVKDARKVAGYDARLTHDQRVKAFKEAVAVQPVAIVMKSSCRTLSNYKRGVLTDDGDCACDEVACIDHAILMVGYDDTAEIPFFKMKNSWGTKWGENGYFRVAQTPAPGGTYGLFGILAEGVVVSGRNTTAVVEDKIQMSPIRQWWVILLITIGCVFMFGVFYTFFRKYFCRPKGW